ncbi:LuxR family transcriptional regulator [Bifidobacterium bifidum LMG 13195]|nr:LuxR family transcriptional regulator [Bifidobacterium bifidum LMG 13195]
MVIADDQELVRAGFAMVIGSQPDIQVVGQAGDGAQAVSLAESLHPDVVLMDVRMPGMDGLEATSRISALEAAAGDAPRKTRVIILTTFDLDEYVMAAINAGASGFLLKDTEPETLLSSIRTVYQGNAIIAPSATKRLIEKMMEDGYTKHGLTATDGYADGSSTMPGARPVAYTDPELNLLTEREREVLWRSPMDCRIRKSPTSCSSACQPRKRTWRISLPKSMRATASRPSSSPTTTVWYKANKKRPRWRGAMLRPPAGALVVRSRACGGSS